MAADIFEELNSKLYAQFSLAVPFNYFHKEKLYGDCYDPRLTSPALVTGSFYKNDLNNPKTKYIIENIKTADIFDFYTDSFNKTWNYQYFKLSQNVNYLSISGIKEINTYIFAFKIADDGSTAADRNFGIFEIDGTGAASTHYENFYIRLRDSATTENKVLQKIILGQKAENTHIEYNSDKTYSLFDSTWHTVIIKAINDPVTKAHFTIWLDGEIVQFKQGTETASTITFTKETNRYFHGDYVLNIGSSDITAQLTKTKFYINIKNIRAYNYAFTNEMVKNWPSLNEIIINKDGTVYSRSVSEKTFATTIDYRIDNKLRTNNSSLSFNELYEFGDDEESGIPCDEGQFVIGKTQTWVKYIKEY